ncbi:hypothetical protein H5410_054582 [Solanum commersonii]|uniref:Uncharacterized protein n=1 Tax=Solanum commersonii TaxID=4109 RepID=A0A9J5WHK2_SOLCO|nr:hypothetical protein H5410_054582 [Solanum commersonii]
MMVMKETPMVLVDEEEEEKMVKVEIMAVMMTAAEREGIAMTEGGWEGEYRTFVGQILFEMDGVSLSNARQAATLAAHKLCSSTKFVRWCIIPMFIAIPSFARYTRWAEVVVDPAITIKAIGHQWYRSPLRG